MVNECRWLSILRIEGSLASPKADAHEEQLVADCAPSTVGLQAVVQRRRHLLRPTACE